MTSSEFALGDLCEIVSSKRVFAADYKDEGVPFFRGKEVSQLARGENVKAELFISEAVYEDVVSRTGKISPGDVLLTAVGTLGNVYRVKQDDPEFYFKDGNVVWLRNFRQDVDSSFLKHWLDSPLGRKKVLNTAIGSTQAALTIAGLSQIRLQLPSLAKQRAIADFLDTTDRLIRLNQGNSSILEKIAQTIFKSWFADFDPVQAKARGEQPEGMDAETAALFPGSFEDSEIGPIPVGWRQGALRDLAELSFGVPYKSTLFSSQGVGRPVIRIRDLSKGFSETYTTEIHPKEHLTTQGDLLIGMDGTFDAVIWLGPKSLVNQRVAIVSPHSFTSQLFLKFATQKELKLLEANATGTTVGHLSKGELELLKVVRASIEVMEKYRDSVEPLLAQMANLASQSRILEELRESLLPRLISGELEIPEELLGE